METDVNFKYFSQKALDTLRYVRVLNVEMFYIFIWNVVSNSGSWSVLHYWTKNITAGAGTQNTNERNKPVV
jgi:hypothetical protein